MFCKGLIEKFERYVNFEFYKTLAIVDNSISMFERYVNFEFYKTIAITGKTGKGLRDM